MNDKDEIVKVKKADLQALIDANTEAYNLLDNITNYADEVKTAISQAHRVLEDAPTEVSDMIVEDEDEETEDKD